MKHITARAALSVAGVISALLLLGIAEAAVRWIAPHPPPRELIGFAEAAHNFLPACGAKEKFGQRRLGRLRLAMVGESSGEMLSTAMAAQIRPESTSLAACAQTGAGIEQIEARFDEVARADPDVVVVVAGHNLRIFTPSGLELAALDLRAHSHLLSWMTSSGASWLPFMPDRHSTSVGPSAVYGPDADPQRLERFEQFLRRAARVSRERGFRLLLTTMTPNYWVPPAPPPAGEDGRQQGFFAARFLRASGRIAEAEEILSAVIATHSHDAPEAEFELGVLLRLSDRPEEARVHLERVLEETRTTRATSATNALIRRVATEEHLLLRDTLRAAEDDASDGIPGWETVSDHCHLLGPVFAREAREILRMVGVEPIASLAAGEGGAAGAGSEPRQRESLEGGVAAGERDPSRIQRLHEIFIEAMAGDGRSNGGYRADTATDATLAVIDWRLLSEGGYPERAALDRLLANLPPSVPASVRARVLVAAAQAFADMRDLRTARELNARARSEDGESALAWVQAGLLDVAEGARDRAATSFRRALEIDPTRPDAKVYLGSLPSESELGRLAHQNLPN